MNVVDLYIVRHGKAEERSPNRGDTDRRLTGEGAGEMRKIASALVALKLHPDSIVSSPLRRARETADIIADGLGLKSVTIWDQLKPEADPDSTFDMIRSSGTSLSIMLVGHEPHLSSLVALVASGGDLRMLLKKGGFVHLEVQSTIRKPYGMLRSIMTPRQMKRMCKGGRA